MTMEFPHPNNQCSCIWPEDSDDMKMGHLNSTIHHCVWERSNHPLCTIMAVDTAMPAGSENVKIHRCACGVTWLERTKLERRIQ